MQPGRCFCACHAEHRGDQREANHGGRFMEAYRHAQDASVAEYKGIGASVTDPVEAASACPLCMNVHCPALLSRAPRGPRIIRVRPPFNPNSDSQQTSGNTNSEGDE